ncbi:hypothetical protein E3N88_09900 [Mikania micrantha]|uniref:Uncharacterized protein n=1 Tax=Mikania micrantha TaxID=192012 RepID=A0A5N6PAA3_9ASTR|nr:hypothetical protein E3N88_09900 [Mikania micrantha]
MFLKILSFNFVFGKTITPEGVPVCTNCCSVPERFVQIVATIEQFVDQETTTLDETIGRLKAFEERTNLMDGGLVNNQEKLMFTCHDKNYGHGRRFENREQGRSKSSQDNWHHRGGESNLVQKDEESTLLMAIKEDCMDNQKFSLDEKETNSCNYWFSLSKYFNNEEPKWIEWKERVTEKVLVPRKENEYENPSSKLVLQAESKNDKVVGLCHNNKKLEGVRVVSPRCKPIKIQKVGVTQVKEGGKQVKDDDT